MQILDSNERIERMVAKRMDRSKKTPLLTREICFRGDCMAGEQETNSFSSASTQSGNPFRFTFQMPKGFGIFILQWGSFATSIQGQATFFACMHEPCIGLDFLLTQFWITAKPNGCYGSSHPIRVTYLDGTLTLSLPFRHAQLFQFV